MEVLKVSVDDGAAVLEWADEYAGIVAKLGLLQWAAAVVIETLRQENEEDE